MYQQNESLTDLSLARQIEVTPCVHHVMRRRRVTTSQPQPRRGGSATSRQTPERQQARIAPSNSPPENRWLGPGFGFRQQAQQHRHLPKPTAADFTRKHNQGSDGAASHQLRISPFLQAPGIDQTPSR